MAHDFYMLVLGLIIKPNIGNGWPLGVFNFIKTDN